MIIHREITPKMVKMAIAKSKEMGVLNNSITTGQGNISGFVGEFVFEDYMNEFYPEFEARVRNTYDYDLLMKDKIKIDVKTKRTTVVASPHHEASIAKYNPNQKCHMYVFVRVRKDLSEAYICGWELKRDFFKKARVLKKGQYDKSNNWHCRSDCFNCFYRDLRQFKRY